LGFGGKKQEAPVVSAQRLAAVAGIAAPVAVGATQQPAALAASLKPDLSRIRARISDATPEDRKRRLAAKTVNFTFTILARLVIIAAIGMFVWNQYQFSGQVPRGAIIGVFAIFADLGRVILKAMEPGTK